MKYIETKQKCQGGETGSKKSRKNRIQAGCACIRCECQCVGVC